MRLGVQWRCWILLAFRSALQDQMPDSENDWLGALFANDLLNMAMGMEQDMCWQTWRTAFCSSTFRPKCVKSHTDGIKISCAPGDEFSCTDLQASAVPSSSMVGDSKRQRTRAIVWTNAGNRSLQRLAFSWSVNVALSRATHYFNFLVLRKIEPEIKKIVYCEVLSPN